MSLPPSVHMVPREYSPSKYFPSVIPVSDVEPAASFKFWVDTSTEPPTLKGWDGAAWVAVGGGGGGGVTDHGALTGLADDDHTQYALADGSRGAFARLVYPDPVASQWVTSPFMRANRDGTASGMPSTSRLYIPVRTTFNVDQCAIRVNTGVAASTVTVTVYADSNGRPGSTLATSPAIDTSSSGTKTATFSSSFAVSAPGVWVGVTCSDTATLSIKWCDVNGPGIGLNSTIDRLVASSSMSASENADTSTFPWLPRVALRSAP